MKTHLYDFFGDEKVPKYDTNKQNGYEVAYCGFQRKNVTHDASKVTCKLCIREIRKRNK